MRSQRGQSLMQFMVVAGLTVLVGTLAARLGVRSEQSAGWVGEKSAIIDIKSELVAINRDRGGWLQTLRTASDYVRACLPDPSSQAFANGVFDCSPPSGSVAVKDAEILGKVPAGGAVVSLSIVDPEGRQIAGSDDSPLMLDSNGGPCSGSTCALKATGYLIREKSSGNPGTVQFMIKVASNSQEVRLKPLYHFLQIPFEEWAMGSSQVVVDACSPGTVAVGILEGGYPKCAPAVTGSCGDPKACYIYGFENGRAKCRALAASSASSITYWTSRVKGPKKGSNAYTVPMPSSSAHIVSVVRIANYNKKKGCDIGDEVRWSTTSPVIRVLDQADCMIKVTIEDAPPPPPPTPKAPC